MFASPPFAHRRNHQIIGLEILEYRARRGTHRTSRIERIGR
jgi:hypothetical protein